MKQDGCVVCGDVNMGLWAVCRFFSSFAERSMNVQAQSS